jgi:hypothetical protein
VSGDSGQLKLVLNANIQFPKVDIPALRDLSYFTHKIGADFSLADFYDVIPWTWLTEWFTGASAYFHMLEEIHYDQSIINYGLISFVSKGQSRCYYESNTQHANTEVATIPTRTESVYNVSYSASRSAELSWRCHIRKDLTSVLDHLKTSSGKGLTPFQKTVLTALAAQRTRPRQKR